MREDRVEALRALVLVVVLQERIRRARNAGDVPRIDEAIGAERLGVPHEQLHRLLRGPALPAVEHLLFLVGELHVSLAGLKDRPYVAISWDITTEMAKALRSNFEPGSPREAVRRAQWKALGLSDADMLKPKIAVVNSSSELAICFSHLDGIAKVVKEAVREAGGLPFEIRTAAPSDFIISAGAGGGYMLASRDLIVNDMEIAVEGAQLDGMICLSSCDKTPPAHLMAAGRFNIPTILVICGYQPSGHYQGKHVDIEEVFIGSVQAMFGKLSKETLAGMCDHAITGPGVCAGMGTANSMHIVCEALGMTLPGAAPVLANSPRMFDIARQSGRRIVEMVWEDLTPRRILTPGCVPQRRGVGAGRQRIDQLHQASAGDRGRSRRGRGSVRALQPAR